MEADFGIGADLLVVRADRDPVPDGALLVRDGRVVWAGARSDMPPFQGKWLPWRPAVLAPGLVDAHSHLTIATPGDEEVQVRLPDADAALRAAGHAAEDLAAGTIGMRLLGEPRGLDRRYVEAARLQPELWPVLVSAGPGVRPSHAAVSVADAVVDHAEDVAGAVERIAADDNAWFKIHATPSSLRGDPAESLYPPPVLVVIIGAAKRSGLRVAAHCHGGPAADACIEAGVDTIEHGRWLSERQLTGMAAKGIVLVSTVGIAARARSQVTGEGAETLLPELAAPLRRAREAGVTVLPGTDAVHGAMHLELEALVAAGYRPRDAFVQATAVAARVCGMPDLGSLEPGKLASAVGLAADPSREVGAWRRPEGVLHAGRLVYRTGRGSTIDGGEYVDRSAARPPA